jgi:predicted Zn-dependent protease
VVLSIRMARLNEAQRFFIIAHELGHLQLRHRATFSSFVARVVSGAGDEQAARAGIESGLSAVSHQAEFEADAFAVRTMRAAGQNPEEAARLFDSLGAGKDNRTHPAAGRRARAIRAQQ